MAVNARVKRLELKLSYRRYYSKNPAMPSSISVYLKTSQPNKKEEAVAGQKSRRIIERFTM